MYEPPREGPTLWEIGTPDRSAAEFFVPEPHPAYVNRLYVHSPDRSSTTHQLRPIFFFILLLTSDFLVSPGAFGNRFRQYGLWERYAELYPTQDLVYVVGESDYTRDWFYAQVTR